jgi:hypothetical protein
MRQGSKECKLNSKRAKMLTTAVSMQSKPGEHSNSRTELHQATAITKESATPANEVGLAAITEESATPADEVGSAIHLNGSVGNNAERDDYRATTRKNST